MVDIYFALIVCLCSNRVYGYFECLFVYHIALVFPQINAFLGLVLFIILAIEGIVLLHI